MHQVVFCVIFVLCFGVGSISGKGSPMKKLRADLLRDYDKFVRPVQDNRTTTVLEIGFSIIRLLKVDEKKSEISFDGWLQLAWNDEYLSWNPQEFDDISVINMPIDDIWQPDLSPYNGKRTTNDKNQEMYALVYNSGKVLWVPSGRFFTHCNLMNNKYQYPKTTHTCTLKIGSWTFSGYAIDYQLQKANLSNLMNNNPYWEITAITSEKTIKYYNCCAEPYPAVKFNFTFQERLTAHHYLSKTLRVASQILFLSMFWLPIAQKMLMGSIALFCCTVYAAQTAWFALSIHPITLSSVTAEFAVGLAAIIAEIIVININQPTKPKRLKIMNILKAGVGKALSLVQSNSKEAPDNPQTNGIMEPSCKNCEDLTTNDGHCKRDSFFFSAVFDRILFVIFTVIFLVVGNYC